MDMQYCVVERDGVAEAGSWRRIKSPVEGSVAEVLSEFWGAPHLAHVDIARDGDGRPRRYCGAPVYRVTHCNPNNEHQVLVPLRL